MSEIDGWLDQHGLGKYVETFAENEIDFDVLEALTMEELKELGIPLGARKRILNAIAAHFDKTPVTSDQTLRPKTAVPSRGEAERRQLTVMFCDLVGSTAISESMDAEDYRDVLAAYQAAVSAAISTHEGYIARFMGDGLLVYFGYPIAQENDPERAARAGLAIVEAVSALESTILLQVRVGIATGPVVVGDIIGEGASEEAAVLGETPNLAARLQSAATPNTVLLSPATHQLLGGRLETKALEPVELKGLSQPIVPYRAVRSRSLSEVSESRRDSTPLIGRDVEVALLERAWRHAQVSEGQAVLLSGEAGVGKSRLLRAFQDAIHDDERRLVQWHCSPYFQTTANYPAIEQLKRTLLLDGDTNDQSLDKLKSFLDNLELDSHGLVPLLSLLLSVPLDDQYDMSAYSPAELKRKLFALQIELLHAAASQTPILFLIEDLHWADPTTLEVLGEMMMAIRDSPVLILMTARPEFGPPWLEQGHVLTQRLRNLSRSETIELTHGIAQERDLPVDLIEQIVDRTEGVPLFVEELTKDLLESASDASVPPSLQDLLTARLDRLGPAKEVAQLASVVGRQFTKRLLAAVFDGKEVELDAAVASLLASGLVQGRHTVAGDSYQFKHALICDTAYASLLKRHQQELHARLLAYFESEGDTPSAHPLELLAYHATAAHAWSKAFDYYVQAGGRATSSGANTEAITLFDNAFASATHIPPSDELTRKLIQVRLELRTPLHALGNNERLEVELRTAREAAEALGDRYHETQLRTYLSNLYRHRGEVQDALSMAEQAHKVAREIEDRPLTICAAFDLAQAQLVTGLLRHSIETCDRALELINPDEEGELFGRPGPASVLLRNVKVDSLASLGEFTSAHDLALANIALADVLGHPFGRTAHWGMAVTEYWRGEFASAIESLEVMREIVERERLRIWTVHSAWMLADLYTRVGQGKEAHGVCCAAIETNHALGYGLLNGRLTAALGFALRALGQNVEAEQHVRDGVAMAHQKDMVGEAWCGWIAGQVIADPEESLWQLEQARENANQLQMRPLAALCALEIARRQPGSTIEAADGELGTLGMTGWSEYLERRG